MRAAPFLTNLKVESSRLLCQCHVTYDRKFLFHAHLSPPQMDPSVRSTALELRDLCCVPRCRFYETFSLSLARGRDEEENDVDADEVCQGVMIGDK